MYRLTRDDGAELRVNGEIWESALELAFVYGWRPAGTETPRTAEWRSRRTAPRPPVWNSRDYFSHDSQHVGCVDARALAEAVLRALLNNPDADPARRDGRGAVEADSASPIPSRASALADGLSAQRRNAMRRFVAFADRGGFTIDRAL